MDKSTYPNINAGLIPFEEACRLIDRAPYTVREWIRQGKFTKYKRGRDVFLSIDELRPKPMPKPARKTTLMKVRRKARLQRQAEASA